MAAIVIAQAVSGLINVAAVAEEFDGVLHPHSLEPLARLAAKDGYEEPLQRSHRDATVLGERLDGIVGGGGEMGPVLDAAQAGIIHTNGAVVSSLSEPRQRGGAVLATAIPCSVCVNGWVAPVGWSPDSRRARGFPSGRRDKRFSVPSTAPGSEYAGHRGDTRT